MVVRLSAPVKLFGPATPAASGSHGCRLSGAIVISILVIVVLGCTSRKYDRAVLIDGTVIYYRPDSAVILDRDYPRPRVVEVAGEVLIHSPGQPTELIIKTPLLVLHVIGPARIEVESGRTEDWAQVHVLSGSATVEKRYNAAGSHPESLIAGDMVMLNNSVDLFEKEQFDPKIPLRWPELK